MSPDPGLTSAAILALLVLSAFAAAVRASLWNASVEPTPALGANWPAPGVPAG